MQAIKNLQARLPPGLEKCACSYGLINPPPLPPQAGNILEGRIAQFREGLIEFCGCEWGQRYMKHLTKQEQAYESDTKLAKRLQLEARQRYQQSLMVDSGTPPKYAEFTLAGYVEKAGDDEGKVKAVKAIMEHYRTGEVSGRKGIFLWGESGVGKTGALTPLFSEYLSKFQIGIWVSYHELMASLKNFKEGSVEERIRQIKDCDYLFIDDLFDASAEKMSTDYERSQLFRIIEHRNTHGKTMFFTSNVDLETISDEAHRRIARRIAENCAIIKVGGKQL